MDRRISPEPPTPLAPVKNEALELKVKQGAHKDAFETALLRADHKRTMDTHDRIISAGVKQATVQQAREESLNPAVESKSALNSFDTLRVVPKTKQNELELLETLADQLQIDFPVTQNNAHANVGSSQPGLTKVLSDETMTMLLKKIQSSHCALGESVALELVDDPSGVMAIQLTRESNDSWSVNLSFTQSSGSQSSDEDELARSLSAQFQQSGLAISAVTVSTDQSSVSAVKG